MNAASSRLAFEFKLWALKATVGLITTITAVVCAVTVRHCGNAMFVGTLEDAGPTDAGGITVDHLVTAIFTVFLAVTFPEPGYTLLVRGSTPMLTRSTVCNAGLLVRTEYELAWAGTLVCRCFSGLTEIVDEE